MDAHEARRIIDSLAGGIDPETGEVLPTDGPLSYASVVRALFAASKALELKARRAPPAGKVGQPWTAEEDQQLLAAFDGGASIQDLAQQHERSHGGIRSRLMRHGRIQLGQPGARTP